MRGRKGAPGCECTHSFSCRACAAAMPKPVWTPSAPEEDAALAQRRAAFIATMPEHKRAAITERWETEDRNAWEASH